MIDKNIINIFALIISFINKPAIKISSIKENYINQILKSINPKVIIFHHVSYFRIKYYKKVRIIVSSIPTKFDAISLHHQGDHI